MKIRNFILPALLFMSMGLTGCDSGFTVKSGEGFVPCEPCRKPMTYRLGQYDSRFGLSREEFLQIVKRAEERWERALGRNLFDYDPDGEMVINMVFDVPEGDAAQLPELTSKLMSLSQEFEVLELEKQNVWTDGDSIRYRALESRSNDLAETIRGLLTNMANLDRASKGSGVRASFLSLTTEEKSRFPGICVYAFSSEGELEFSLSHEFGHALGLPHLENGEATMYAKRHLPDGSSIGLPASPMPSDIAAFNESERLTLTPR